MIKALYILLGTLTLGLGLLGIVLPLLPTTPMLLLTTYFWAKGSPRFHNWFIQTWLYKKYLEDFVETRAMTLGQKLRLLIFVDIMLLFPFFTMPTLLMRTIIIILVITKYWYFFTQIKTIKKELNHDLKTSNIR